MKPDFYNPHQTFDGWITTIKEKFSYISIKNSDEIFDILGVGDLNERNKIIKANLYIFGEKLGVTSFEDACIKLNIIPIDLKLLKDKHLIAYYKLSIIIEALNEGWYPDWDNDSQMKYFAYFNKNSGVFSCYSTDYNISDMIVPSALYLKSEDLAYYIGNYFIDLYKDIYFK
jgi:hypothetical protein